MSAVNENPFNKNLTLNNLNKENEWKSQFALRFEIYGNRALKIILALILIVGMLPIFNFPLFKNEVAVADDAPEFGSVAINQGARISLSGNKSITSLATSTGGNLKMFSDQTGGIEVAGPNLSSSVNSFLSTNYSSDALASSLSSASLLSVNDINSYRYFLPVGDKAYWLSDKGNNGSLSWQAYAKANNTLDNVSLKATGKIDGRNYENTVIASGSYAWSKNATLSNFDTDGKGAKWDLSSSSINQLKAYRTDKTWFGVGTTVHNNPNLLSTGKDWSGTSYRSTTVSKLTQESAAKLFGYVKDGLIYQAQPGDQIKRGTTCVYCFVKQMKELKNQSGFAGNDFIQTGFIQTQQDFEVLNRYVETQDVYGMSAFNSGEKTVVAQNISSSQMAIRPSMTLNSSKIAFFRNATSAKATTGSAMQSLPISNALKGSSYKAVVKDEALKLSLSLNQSNFEADQGTVRVEGSTIHVPYGAKILKLKMQML